VSRTLDALRQHNGTSLDPDAAPRRRSTEENVLASLGYPAQRSGHGAFSPIFRVLLVIAVVLIVVALLWQVAVGMGLLPQGLLPNLFGGRTAARTAAPPPLLQQQPPVTQREPVAPAPPVKAAPDKTPAAPVAAAPAVEPVVPPKAAPPAAKPPVARKPAPRPQPQRVMTAPPPAPV
jgi:outer membrane biosynthesis protein TonB